MVVLAASIITKAGKALISRQFRDIPRSRIEVLLTSFPKLVSPFSQHTSVETDSVRFVYQPFDELYVLLITNKQSNILQDIQTLSIVTRVTSDIAQGRLDEPTICEHAFEILNAYDEIVTMGYTESLTLPQIQTILTAESHEERIQEMITRNKELEAAEESKRKTKQLEMARREAQRAGASARSAHIGGFGTASPLLGSGGTYQAVQSAAPIEDQYTSSKAPVAPAFKGTGMKLGTKKQARVFDSM